MQTIFTLASGRSGTHFLYELIRRNAADCAARHETYGYNPSMFGRAIYDHAVGETERTRKLLARKQQIIAGIKTSNYVETSHAFLKSWFDLAPEFFPQLKLVHLIRDPLYVAKSEAYRETWIKKLHVPFCHYRGDGKGYFLWSLTGLEPIFRHFDTTELTRLQWYVIQWIEIENRAVRFLDQFQLHAQCLTLHSPHDLNNAERVRHLFEFLGLKLRQADIAMTGRRNKNWRPTVIHDDDRRQFEGVVESLPGRYLEIFHREPYRSMPWTANL